MGTTPTPTTPRDKKLDIYYRRINILVIEVTGTERSQIWRCKMSKYDEFFPRQKRPPFEPTPWLVIIIVVMAIAFTSYLSQSC
jgi:hypothetical protein